MNNPWTYRLNAYLACLVITVVGSFVALTFIRVIDNAPAAVAAQYPDF